MKRVYEADPLECPHCGGVMKVIAFIESRQADVIARIMRHCRLWQPSSPRAPPAGGPDPCAAASPADPPQERTYVDMETFWATF